MIRKITVNEYLKRLDNMNGEERQKYNERVGKWLRNIATRKLTGHINDPDAKLQNVLQCSTGWNDTECHTFEEGALLMTAVQHSMDTWLPDMLYTKSAKRVIRRMVEVLAGVAKKTAIEKIKQAANKQSKEESAEGKAASKQEQNGADSDSAEREQTRPEVNQKATQTVDKSSQIFTIQAGEAVNVAPEAKSTTTTQMPETPVTNPAPVRPKHIDQYIHLLPAKTQEHASQVKDLLCELDSSRERLRKLMDDDTVGAAVREAWAKKVTAIDNKLRKIYNELDSEWDKLVKEGRVELDDLGNAHVVNLPEDGSLAELTKEQKAKRKNLRKWLVDMRYGNGATREDYVKRWRENFKEYLSLQGDTAFDDEKIKTSAEHYGVEIEEFKNK